MKDQEINEKFEELESKIENDDLITFVVSIGVLVVVFGIYHYGVQDDNYQCIKYKEQITDDYANYCNVDCRRIVDKEVGDIIHINYRIDGTCFNECVSKATPRDKESICVLEAIARKPKK